jgi:hypothetical protein
MSNYSALMNQCIPSTSISMEERLRDLATLLSYRENIRFGQFSVQ